MTGDPVNFLRLEMPRDRTSQVPLRQGSPRLACGGGAFLGLCSQEPVQGVIPVPAPSGSYP